jgi:hypothetical protein
MQDRELGAYWGPQRPEADAVAEGLLSNRQMSILLGLSQDEIRAEFSKQRGDTPDGVQFTFRMPRAWVRSGKARTALSRTDDMGWAVQILEVHDDPAGRWVDSSGAVWKVTGRNEIDVPVMATAGSTVSGPQIGLTVQQVVESFGPIRKIGGAA